MVNVVLGAHHHLEGGDELATGGAVPCYTEEPGTANGFSNSYREVGHGD